MTSARLVGVWRGSIVGPAHPEDGVVVLMRVEDAERLIAEGDAVLVFDALGAPRSGDWSDPCRGLGGSEKVHSKSNAQGVEGARADVEGAPSLTPTSKSLARQAETARPGLLVRK